MYKRQLLGTPVDAIDLAEDRGQFGALLRRLGIKHPPYGTALSAAEAVTVAEDVGLPLLVRPSFVLGGRAMEICYSTADLNTYLAAHVKADQQHPLLLDRFLENAIEVDVDALCDGTDCFVAAVMQHVEEAGVPLLGTPVDAIDLAEDRGRFGALLRRLGIEHPPYGLSLIHI